MLKFIKLMLNARNFKYLLHFYERDNSKERGFMNINRSNNLAFRGVAPYALNEIREEMRSKGASVEEYDEFLQTLASDRSGEDFRIETRLPDGRSSGRFRVLDNKKGFDLGILHSLKDAINYANNLADAKYADDKETKLKHLEKAEEVIESTIYDDYGYDGSRRLQNKMKKAVGLDIEA